MNIVSVDPCIHIFRNVKKSDYGFIVSTFVDYLFKQGKDEEDTEVLLPRHCKLTQAEAFFPIIRLIFSKADGE